MLVGLLQLRWKCPAQEQEALKLWLSQLAVNCSAPLTSQNVESISPHIHEI